MKHYSVIITIGLIAVFTISACKPASPDDKSQKAAGVAAAADTPKITRWEIIRLPELHKWESKVTLSNVAQASDYFQAASRIQIRNYTYSASASMQLAYNINFSTLAVADSCNYAGQEEYHEFYIKNGESISQAGEIILKPGKMPPPQQRNKGTDLQQFKLSDSVDIDRMIIEQPNSSTLRVTITLKSNQLMSNIGIVRTSQGAYVLLLTKTNNTAAGAQTRSIDINNFNKKHHVLLAAWRSNLTYDGSGQTCYIKEGVFKLNR